MIKHLLIITCLPIYGYAQNLVVNPSFENDAVPLVEWHNGLVGEKMHWWEANNATIDLYGPLNNNCVVADTIVMQAHHGENFLGSIISEFGFINYSEIFQGELVQMLQKDKKYLIGAYLRFGIHANYRSSDFSMGVSRKKQYERWFFNRSVVRKSYKEIPVDSISDQWKFISSIYLARGNEKYVVLGSLRGRINLPNTTKANPAASTYKYLTGASNHGYMDIDDVFIIEIPENYGSIKQRSFSFERGQQLALVPQISDSVVLISEGFRKDEWKLNDSLLLKLNKLTDYLIENPFITIELSLPENTNTKMSQLDRLRNRRDQALELYFENKGISYNRIHLKWNEAPTGESRIIVKIHDVLFR
jgi:hypothetical protein